MRRDDEMSPADWRAAQWTVAVLGVALMALALCQGGCGALPAVEANAIPDRCACQCGPVEVSVGWADGSGKICAGAGAWRSCWALTGGE